MDEKKIGMPLVSVLIPAFNAEKYVEQAIRSVLEQTHTNLEVIVLDDGSEDATAEVVGRCSDPRLRLVRNVENRGLASIRNQALDLAQGEYIAWLDADDRSSPCRLEVQVRHLQRNPAVGVVGSWVVGEQSTGFEIWKYPSHSSIVRARLLFDNPIAMSSALMRRAVLDSYEGREFFRAPFAPAEDYDFWVRVSSRGWRLANLRQKLTFYRVHPFQTSHLDKSRQLRAIGQIQREVLGDLGVVPSAEEMALHLKLGIGWGADLQTSDLPRVREWFQRLSSANDMSAKYSPLALRRVMDRRLNLVRDSKLKKPLQFRSRMSSLREGIGF